jgi:glycosyltransferase involved in cell wall biosynthesis
MEKIKVLITNQDVHGVNFYRSEQPAIVLSQYHSDEFDVDYQQNIDWNDDNFLKQYQIIHGHRTFCDFEFMPSLVQKLHDFGIITILDIDDYWEVSIEHPLYQAVKRDNYKEKITNNLKLVKAVTTTTPVFQKYIEKYNKNVFVIANGINDELPQWQYDKNKKDTNKLKILYLAGSSHLQDVNLLKDSFDKLIDDNSLVNKFEIHLSGFDLRGNSTLYKVNDELVKDLTELKVLTPNLVKILKSENLTLNKILNELITYKLNSSVINYIKDKYSKNNLIYEEKAKINPKDTVWSKYESIFTSNYKLINDINYYNYLMSFDLENDYSDLNNQNYFRHKTQGLYKFGFNYKNGDIALAPIKVYGKGVNDDNSNNRYQFAKSNLKVIETAFHKIPVIASDVPTYNHDSDWVDGENIFLINPDRQYKDWYKKIKFCINNPEKVKEMGEAAYQLAKNKYDLKVITKKRVEIYKNLIKTIIF